MREYLGHVKLIIWFSDTDFKKNDEGGRVFNFCIYMHIGFLGVSVVCVVTYFSAIMNKY